MEVCRGPQTVLKCKGVTCKPFADDIDDCVFFLHKVFKVCSHWSALLLMVGIEVSEDE